MANLGSTIITGNLSVSGNINGYKLASASTHGVDTSLSSGTTSTNLPTSKAIVDYVNTAINTWKTNNSKTSSDLTVSGATVSVPAGYYSSAASKTIASGAYSASVALTAGSGSASLALTSNNVSATASDTKGTYYIQVTGTGSGTVSGVGTATVGTAGYLATGSKSSSSTSKSSNSATATKYYNIPAGSCSVTASSNPTTSITTQPSTSITTSSGISTTTTKTDYSITATAKSGVITASVGAIYDTHTAGYIPAKSKTQVIAGSSSTSTEKTSSTTIYIPKAVIKASATITKPSVAISASGSGADILSTTKPSSGTDGTNYWTLTTSGTGTNGVVDILAETSEVGYLSADSTGTGSEDIVPTITGGKSYYLSKASLGASVSISKPTVTISKSGTATNILSTTKPSSGTNGTDYWTLAISGSNTTNGSATPKATASTAGYLPANTSATGSATTVTATISGTTNYYLSKGSLSASGSITKTPSVDISESGTAMDILSATKPSSGTNGTDYWTLAISGTATAGTVTPKATASTAGYLPANTSATGSVSVTPAVTDKISYYLSKAIMKNATGTVVKPTVTRTISGTSVSKNIITTTKPSGTDGTDYWTFIPSGTSTDGSATAYTSCSKPGYIPDSFTLESAPEAIPATITNGSTYYVPKATLSFSGGAASASVKTVTGVSATASTTNTSGIGVTITPQATSAAVTYTNSKLGILPAATNSTALSAGSISGTAVSYYLTDLSLASGKTLNSFINNGGTLTNFHHKSGTTNISIHNGSGGNASGSVSINNYTGSGGTSTSPATSGILAIINGAGATTNAGYTYITNRADNAVIDATIPQGQLKARRSTSGTTWSISVDSNGNLIWSHL